MKKKYNLLFKNKFLKGNKISYSNKKNKRFFFLNIKKKKIFFRKYKKFFKIKLKVKNIKYFDKNLNEK